MSLQLVSVLAAFRKGGVDNFAVENSSEREAAPVLLFPNLLFPAILPGDAGDRTLICNPGSCGFLMQFVPFNHKRRYINFFSSYYSRRKQKDDCCGKPVGEQKRRLTGELRYSSRAKTNRVLSVYGEITI